MVDITVGQNEDVYNVAAKSGTSELHKQVTPRY